MTGSQLFTSNLIARMSRKAISNENGITNVRVGDHLGDRHADLPDTCFADGNHLVVLPHRNRLGFHGDRGYPDPVGLAIDYSAAHRDDIHRILAVGRQASILSIITEEKWRYTHIRWPLATRWSTMSSWLRRAKFRQILVPLSSLLNWSIRIRVTHISLTVVILGGDRRHWCDRSSDRRRICLYRSLKNWSICLSSIFHNLKYFEYKSLLNKQKITLSQLILRK